MASKTKLFRDLVNDIIDTLALANDRCGALRDCVDTEKEKEVFNRTRQVLQTELLPMFRRYRNDLPAGVGNKELGTGWKGHCKCNCNEED